ncbi:Octanoyltransferase [Penicillium sp. IBT 18751x]|nr:Octanoyltransferase [Penicillium sp. IBT 18751x]
MRLAHLHLPHTTPFKRVSELQQALTTRFLTHKKLASPGSISSQNTTLNLTSLPPPPDPTIITFTPNPVYTTGRRDLPPSNTCASATLSLPPPLEPIRSLLEPSPTAKAEYVPTLRGGQTTYHGPGQMVAYTILDLKRLGLTPRCHIRVLENSVIDLLRRYEVKGFVTEDPGVWVDDGVAKKITAVGVHLRRNINRLSRVGWKGRRRLVLRGVGVSVGVDEVANGFVDCFVKRVNEDFACDEASGEKIEEVYSVQEEDLKL